MRHHLAQQQFRQSQFQQLLKLRWRLLRAVGIRNWNGANLKIGTRKSIQVGTIFTCAYAGIALRIEGGAQSGSCWHQQLATRGIRLRKGMAAFRGFRVQVCPKDLLAAARQADLW
jgi:hypothetical protein